MPGFHSIGFPCERGTLSTHSGRYHTIVKFPFNWFPLREGNLFMACNCDAIVTGFHSIGFPCERGTEWCFHNAKFDLQVRFHSIGFPCERGTVPVWRKGAAKGCFHSIGFPCERGTDRSLHAYRDAVFKFPFNWFPLREGNRRTNKPFPRGRLGVSIQLVSPARGEHSRLSLNELRGWVSIQLVSPARGEL